MNEIMFRDYLYDLGIILKEKSFEAKKRELESKNLDSHSYDLGFLMAMHEVISLMQQQAVSFEIDPQDIGLGEIDPDRDLL